MATKNKKKCTKKSSITRRDLLKAAVVTALASSANVKSSKGQSIQASDSIVF